MMALRANQAHPLDGCGLHWIDAREAGLHVRQFLVQDLVILALRDTVADVEYVAGKFATGLAQPLLEHLSNELLNIGLRDHLDSYAIGLAC